MSRPLDGASFMQNVAFGCDEEAKEKTIHDVPVHDIDYSSAQLGTMGNGKGMWHDIVP